MALNDSDHLNNSSGLTWEVIDGDFKTNHPGELAADGNEDTFLWATSNSGGGTRTVFCKFKKTYRVKQVWTTLHSSADNSKTIDMALYKGPYEQVTSFSALNTHETQSQSIDRSGNRLRLVCHGGDIKLAKIQIFVQKESSHAGN